MGFLVPNPTNISGSRDKQYEERQTFQLRGWGCTRELSLREVTFVQANEDQSPLLVGTEVLAQPRIGVMMEGKSFPVSEPQDPLLQTRCLDSLHGFPAWDL